jgi:predicted DsbA family dithiol-disulfide isomerase
MLLLRLVHSEGGNPADRDVLVQAAKSAGLDPARARAILESQEFAKDVREREQFYQQQGIHAVPSVIVNDRHLIQGGQPPEVFERALRQIAAEAT